MHAAIPDENAPPESYAADKEQRASPLFRAWAREAGGTPARKIVELGQLVKSRYARGRISSVLSLTTTQFEAACREVGGEDSWRSTFEFFVDGEFKKPQVPSSVALAMMGPTAPGAPATPVPLTLSSPAPPEEALQAKCDYGKQSTLTKVIGSEQVKNIYVPAAVWEVNTTPSPFVNALGDKDVKAVANEWAAWTFANFGILNVGALFRSRCARQITSRLPKLQERKSNGKPAQRGWDSILMRKAYMLDRPDATVRGRASNQTAGLPPPPPPTIELSHRSIIARSLV